MLRSIMKRPLEGLIYQFARRARIARPARLRRLGSPATVVDVGVGDGTPELYKAFPEAKLVLIEPLVEYENSLQKICQKRARAEYFLVAAGAAKCRKEISVDPRLPQSSSFYGRTRLTQSTSELQLRSVDVMTLDDLLAEHPFPVPFGLKIDTEGFELDVIRGAGKFLESTAFVIAEVSILKRFEGSYRFEEMIAEMDRHGFCVYDILSVMRPDLTGTRFVNIAFLNPAWAGN